MGFPIRVNGRVERIIEKDLNGIYASITDVIYF